ncbi:U2 small nuclear ribonucleoprotein A'-like [Oppia nitens]|uniref:U2 small nuclear ribonucleoprotein A'-like n=1 Tax=Oppia nitens TaxID=1686743 RepID=UPI0023DC973D|nr:U2 small nuclear ribonucleoprotein A'-like [Oppia nitens]
MKLTPELIESGYQYINRATRDRELDLRAYKVTVIENLGATLDQFDSIDFSDNDIRKLDGFPLLNRLKTLLLNNNRISRIGDSLHESLPHLESLILTGNHMQELGDIEPLAKCDKLTTLSLLNNPVTTKKHYRLYVIHKLPTVRLLDFRKVKLRERDEAKQLFKGDKGRKLESEIGVKSKTFVPGGGDEQIATKESTRPVHTAADVEAIKAAIAKAQTLEEIERLNQLLKSGYIPGKSDVNNQRNDNKTSQQQVVEEEDDDDMDTNTN